MDLPNAFEQFVILGCPFTETFCVIHIAGGFLIADGCPTYEDAWVEMMAVAMKSPPAVEGEEPT